MDEGKFEGIIQEAIESEPLKGFELKLLGIGADKMVFETPGSDRKIVKVSIEDVMHKVRNVLADEAPKAVDDIEEKRLRIIEEHKKLEKELSEVFGQEHLLRNGIFRVKIPITKDVLLKALSDIECAAQMRTEIETLDADKILEIETIAETQIKAKEIIDPEKFKTKDHSVYEKDWPNDRYIRAK
ncbi:MAG: hypothetical protein NTV72_03290 [Candidatus Taylorbacteria bacterium]|nr:hypothetical protein [Candidatus Taylorbacteria bacterium]